jgi:serine/threonine-protein kinase RsbW
MMACLWGIAMGDRKTLEPFEVVMDGSECAVRGGLARVLSGLAPLKLDVDAAGTVELVLAEALNNVVEHALAHTGGQTRIVIRLKHDTLGLHVTIVDRGVPMPDGMAPRGRAPEVAVEMPDMPEGGFGWFMIHSLAQNVSYARVGGENHLTLRIAVGL